MTPNPTRPRSLSGLWLLTGWLAVGMSVPLLLGAGADDSARAADHRRQIAEMSAAERRALEENYDEFRALSEAERDQYRRLHADLQRNPALKGVLDEYSTWLRTLSPWQRQALQAEYDWSKRLEIVRAIREEQKSAQARRRSDERERWAWMRPIVWMARRFPGFPEFSRRDHDATAIRRDLAPVMQVIESSLPRSPQLDQQLQSAGVGTPVRYVRVLTAALTNAVDPSDSSEGRPDWPDAPLLERILETLSEWDRRRIEDYRNRSEFLRRVDPAGKRLLLAVIANEIDKLWWAEVKRLKPGEEDIPRLLQPLDERRKTEIQFAPASEREEATRRLYHRELRSAFWKEAEQLVQLLERVIPQPGPPGTGSRGPSRGDGRGDGDRRDRGEGRR